jgi:arylsulfatase A-like enzyme
MTRNVNILIQQATTWGLLCAIAAVSSAASSDSRAAATKPNIIFILADDLGYGDLGCYGQKVIKTPNIDRVASEGLRFTEAYAGATVCAPSRCVLMTGLHIGHARIRGLRPVNLPGANLEASDITVAKVLKDAGYTTGCIGKWGLGEPKKFVDGLPSQQGFDSFYGYLTHGEAHNYYPPFLWRNDHREKLPNVLSKDPKFKNLVSEKKVIYSHDLLTNESLKFVRQHKDENFFLYLCFTTPHVNNQEEGDGFEVPDHGQYEKENWPSPEKGKAAMISRMDKSVGKLMALLKELHLDDNTLVVFTSDNGPPQSEGGRLPEFNDSNGPLRGYKGQLYEGGIRIPFIARWPGYINPSTSTNSIVTFADVLPTLTNIGNGKSPAEIDGLDFSPTLVGKDQPQLTDRKLYWEYGKYGVYLQAARWKNWKAVHDLAREKTELYDLAADLGETHDVAVEHPDLIEEFNKFLVDARSDSALWPLVSKNKPADDKTLSE